MPRAILSVSDKGSLVDFALGLLAIGWELTASGGTAATLRRAGLQVTEVTELTGFPELLGGRVKTLHPAVHASILATASPEHMADLAAHGLTPIDLVVCNLYPFAATVARKGVALEDAVEQIDIGGVALLRAAAKNFARVAVLCDPMDYGPFLAELQAGPVSLATRKQLAYKAFGYTAAYDAAIEDFLAARGFASPGAGCPETALNSPPELRFNYRLAQPLRYGENPHQSAALYNRPGVAGPLGGRLLHGKPLSYNNLLDLDAAWRAVRGFPNPAIAIVKHTNPCGLAIAPTLVEAYPYALAGDPEAAYGGILAANRTFDESLAAAIGTLFLECIIAPGFDAAALARLAQRPNIRLLEIEKGGMDASAAACELRTVHGGLLVQQADLAPDDKAEWRVVTRKHPTGVEERAAGFAWEVARHLKSNAVCLVQPFGGETGDREGLALVGAGAGQMSRVDAVHMATYKAGERARRAVLGSDAFFPFADGIEMAAAAGVTAVIQPGGSIRDADVVAAADRLGLAMIFTGKRHFRH